MEHEFYHDLINKWSRFKDFKDIEKLCFQSLIDSYKRVRTFSGVSRLSENRIRDKFVVDMETKSVLISAALQNRIIEIIPERWDPLRRKRSDIVFSIALGPRLVFECKKLSSASNSYINDGLLRFVKLEYASDEKQAGMIGFILDQNIPQRLRRKIEQCCIVQFIDNPILDYSPSYQSIHARIDSTPILMSHLFFYFEPISNGSIAS